jgi:hypothetical protein
MPPRQIAPQHYQNSCCLSSRRRQRFSSAVAPAAPVGPSYSPGSGFWTVYIHRRARPPKVDNGLSHATGAEVRQLSPGNQHCSGPRCCMTPEINGARAQGFRHGLNGGHSRGSLGKARLDSPRSHSPTDFGTCDDELQDSTCCRRTGSASHRVVAPVAEESRTRGDRAASLDPLGEWDSRCSLADLLEERLLLVGRKKSEESGCREQQRLRVVLVQIGASQEIGANHFQTIASRSITSQHQSCSLDRVSCSGLSPNKRPSKTVVSSQSILTLTLDSPGREGRISHGCTWNPSCFAARRMRSSRVRNSTPATAERTADADAK